MKRAKRLYILFGVLVVLCIATVCVLQYDQKQEEIQTSGEIILTVDADTVSALDWETESDPLAFHKDGSWLYDEDEAFPVSEEKINDLLAEFEDFRAAFVIENVTDFAQYGLDEPVCTIDITTSDTNYEIQLGDYSSMDSQRYVSIGDGNVYLSVNDPLDAFDLTLSDMIAHDEVPSFDEVSSIHFDGPEAYDVVWQEYSEDNAYTVCSDDVYYKQEGDDLLPLDTSAVEGYLSAISNAGYTEYVTYNVTDEELATYGLDDPEVTVTVEYTELDGDTETPGTFTLSVSRDPVELAAQATEEVPDESSSSAESTEETITAYARINDSKIIYKISGSSYEELMACTYDDLRHTEVLTADFADVTGFDISLEGQVYTITSKGSGDDKTFLYGDEELDISALESALIAVSADEFTAEEPTQKEELGMTVTLDNEAHPKVQIEFYRYDGEHCLAVVDGAPFALVTRSAVVDLIEAVNAIVL